jgi:hypothetical protein
MELRLQLNFRETNVPLNSWGSNQDAISFFRIPINGKAKKMTREIHQCQPQRAALLSRTKIIYKLYSQQDILSS